MHDEAAGRPEHQHVIVIGTEEGLDGDDAIAARLVFDDDRLPPFDLQHLANSRAPISAPAPGPNGTMNLTTRVGQFCACCARAASGHVATPPSTVMNSRRLMMPSKPGTTPYHTLE